MYCLSYDKTKDLRNLGYHGTGSEERAREAARGQQKEVSTPEHCNVYDMGDRKQLKQ